MQTGGLHLKKGLTTLGIPPLPDPEVEPPNHPSCDRLQRIFSVRTAGRFIYRDLSVVKLPQKVL